MRVAIHQPNFMPWWPYFDKIKRCDRFVIMSYCQFESGERQNRFEFGGRWYTMGVPKGIQQLREKRYSAPQYDWLKIKRRLPQYATFLSQFDDCISADLVGTNTEIILRLCRILGIKTEIVFDQQTDLVATARLVHICRQFGATHYLSGMSGRSYLDIGQFSDAGITVEYQGEVNCSPIIEVLSGKSDSQRPENSCKWNKQ